MIRYLIKNNFKIMFRNAMNILMLVLAPLAVIAVLSSAFSALMEKYEDTGSFNVGYRIEGDENTAITQALFDIAKDQGITFVRYDSGDEKDLVRTESLGGFVVFSGDSYTVYEKDESKGEGQMVEYLIHAFFEKASVYMNGRTVPESINEGLLVSEKAEHMPEIDSTDYYGIIYVIYFSWCTIVCGAGLFAAEKRYRIKNKIMVSGVSECKFYLAKLIPLTLVVCAGISACTVISVCLFGVHWGNVLWSAALVIAGILAAGAMGLMFYSIFDNMAMTVIVVFMLVWVWGFLGGSFETYMFSGHAEFIKQLSPIYYENRAAVELSCMGKSDYVSKSLLISGLITVICSAASVFAGTIRRRGRA